MGEGKGIFFQYNHFYWTFWHFIPFYGYNNQINVNDFREKRNQRFTLNSYDKVKVNSYFVQVYYDGKVIAFKTH